MIPPDTSMQVPVCMPLRSLSMPKCSCLVEPKEVKRGSVFTAHSLLPTCDRMAAVAVVNLGTKDFVLESETSCWC